MYAILCGGCSDAADLLYEGRLREAVDLLQQNLLSAEELYLAGA